MTIVLCLVTTQTGSCDNTTVTSCTCVYQYLQFCILFNHVMCFQVREVVRRLTISTTCWVTFASICCSGTVPIKGFKFPGARMTQFTDQQTNATFTHKTNQLANQFVAYALQVCGYSLICPRKCRPFLPHSKLQNKQERNESARKERRKKKKRKRKKKRRRKKKEKKEKVYSTRYSQAVTHPSTNLARRCLTSVIGREPVFSTWYGRRHLTHSFTPTYTQIPQRRTSHDTKVPYQMLRTLQRTNLLTTWIHLYM